MGQWIKDIFLNEGKMCSKGDSNVPKDKNLGTLESLSHLGMDLGEAWQILRSLLGCGR